MELEVKESASLEDGTHTGKIDKVEYRTEPFEYTDVYIKETKTGYSLKYGCPTVVSEKSKLGKLLSLFVEIKAGKKVTPENILVGKDVTFMTLTKQRKDKQGEFTEIVDGSIKPLVVQEKVELDAAPQVQQMNQ